MMASPAAFFALASASGAEKSGVGGICGLARWRLHFSCGVLVWLPVCCSAFLS